MTRLKIRTAVVAVAVGLLGLGTGTAALAATASATGSANPNLTVTLSVSPSQLVTGQTATVTKTVTNNTSGQQSVLLDARVLAPNGQTYAEPTQTVSLSPGQTLSQTESDVIASSYPRGTYTATFSATGMAPPGSPSTSTARVTYTISK